MDKSNQMIEEIRKQFFQLEKEHFYILNNYLTSQLKIQEVKEFGEKIAALRLLLDQIDTTEENLLEIAKYKSKIQHFYTEIMEDEELLGAAYNNNL